MITISDIFKMVQNEITADDLIPISELKDKKAYYEEKIGRKLPLFDEILKSINSLDKKIEHFYLLMNSLTPFYYFDGLVFLEIYGFNECINTSLMVKETIEARQKYAKKCVEDGDFRKLFAITEKRALFMLYQNLFDLIPDTEKFDIFIDIYARAEYGFSSLDRDFVKKVFSYKPQRKIKIKTDEDGTVEIFRGICSGSTPAEKSYSWTTDLGVAVYFATRFEIEGEIYRAKVRIEDVVAVIGRRREEEVIVEPEKLIELKKMELIEFANIVGELEESGLIDIYHAYVHDKKLVSYFQSPKSVHGLKHAKRVLLLNLILSWLNELDNDDMDILIQSSLYHDIGRTNDNKDPEHGKASYRKMKEKNLIKGGFKEDVQITKYIIENHCVSDKYAFENVEGYPIEDKERAVNLLKIFKDSDSLDRVRIRDLNVRYLRNEHSKRLVLLAGQLLEGVE